MTVHGIVKRPNLGETFVLIHTLPLLKQRPIFYDILYEKMNNNYISYIYEQDHSIDPDLYDCQINVLLHV